MNKQRGFTLVELLVVISIIGILASVVFVNFGSARESARNNATMAELKELQLALEIFRAQNGRYPGADFAAQANCTDDDSGVHFAQQGGIGFNGSTNCAGFTNYIGEPSVGYLSPEFIGDLPLAVDSSNPNCHFLYQVEAGGGWYKMTAVECFEGASDATEGIQGDTEFSRCPSSCRTTLGCSGSGTGVAYDTYAGTASFYESMAVYSSGGECE